MSITGLIPSYSLGKKWLKRPNFIKKRGGGGYIKVIIKFVTFVYALTPGSYNIGLDIFYVKGKSIRWEGQPI